MTNNLTIAQYLQSDPVQKNIEGVLGDRKNQFITSVASLVNANPKLQEVDRKSLFSACLVAASLDLPINQNLGFAYIIPYKNEAQFQMGYKGFVQLAMRSGQFKTINVSDVREGEYQGIDRLSGELRIDWIEEGRDALPVIGYVAFMKLINGFEKSLYMTVDQLNIHGKRYSQSMRKGYGLWKDDFDAMAKKTVLKLLLSKFAPMSTEMASAVEMDQSSVSDGRIRYVDNMIENPEEVAAEKERSRIIKHIEDSRSLNELESCLEAVSSQDSEVQNMYEAKQELLTLQEEK